MSFEEAKLQAKRIASHFNGALLSEERFSIVKGQQALKFKCANDHQFYKFVTELDVITRTLLRKSSISTAEP